MRINSIWVDSQFSVAPNLINHDRRASVLLDLTNPVVALFDFDRD